MSRTICETCFPGWREVENLTVAPFLPCDRCGTHDKCHVFRNSVVAPPALQPHQQRVVAEQAELADRIGKLITFLASDKAKEVPPAEYARLRRQRDAMEQYDAVLLERIAAFGAPA